MKIIAKSLLVLPILALSACGGGFLMNGSQQSIVVDAFPHTAAGVSCIAENERGAYNVPIVPQAVQVERAYGPLSIKCRSTDGQTGSAILSSSSDNLGTAGSIISGPIALTQDLRSGGMFSYPPSVVVAMKSTMPTPIADAAVAPITVYAAAPVVTSVVRHVRRPVRHTAHRIPSK